MRAPDRTPAAPSVLFEHFWVERGPDATPHEASSRFVATPSVKHHLRNLARAVQLRRHPILLQVLHHQCCPVRELLDMQWRRRQVPRQISAARGCDRHGDMC